MMILASFLLMFGGRLLSDTQRRRSVSSGVLSVVGWLMFGAGFGLGTTAWERFFGEADASWRTWTVLLALAIIARLLAMAITLYWSRRNGDSET